MGNNYGVINEQGFVAGQLGFNEMSKDERDRLLNENKENDKDSKKES